MCTTHHTSTTLVSPVEISQHTRPQLPGYDNFMGLVQYSIVWLMVIVYYHILLATQCTCTLLHLLQAGAPEQK